MLPKELMKTIFSFQECFFYSVQRNTIRNMEKIIHSMIQFRPKFNYWEQKFKVLLPINKNKHLFLEKNIRVNTNLWVFIQQKYFLSMYVIICKLLILK